MAASKAPFALLWWYEHMLSGLPGANPATIEDLTTRVTKELKDLGPDHMPAPLVVRMIVRGMHPAIDNGDQTVRISPDNDMALTAIAMLANTITRHDSEFSKAVDLRRVTPPLTLLDNIAAFTLANGIARAVRQKKKVLTADQVQAQLVGMLETYNLGSIAGDQTLQAK